MHGPRVLYFDCFSGLAGDMTLGALIDLGLDVEALVAALRTLPLEGWHLEHHTVVRNGLRATDVHVKVGEAEEGPAVESPEGDAHHHHHHDDHHHHHYRDIVNCIEGGRLPAEVVRRARAAFDEIARAEAHVHGSTIEEVHFHEVGAVDSIIDIVGVAWGLWSLGIDHVESAPPPIGRGFIRSAHGRMPCPAPATLEILKGLPIIGTELNRELVTPTGAAFVKAWARRVGSFPEMVVEGVGFGAGDAEFPDRPNLLRLVLGREQPEEARCFVTEVNLDDLNPEITGYLMDALFAAGALDVWFTPVHMKRNRPGVVVGALTEAGKQPAVESVLLEESSSLGLRRFPVSRVKQKRAHVTVQTPFGAVPVKVGRRQGSVTNVAPEHVDCVRLAQNAGVPLKVVYQHAIAAYLNGEER
ncbi:MAG: nickel pincer cofactor biosynthesis protein LarC [Bradymonadia bacterium]